MVREFKVPVWLVGCFIVGLLLWDFFAADLIKDAATTKTNTLQCTPHENRNKLNSNLEEVFANYTELHKRFHNQLTL